MSGKSLRIHPDALEDGRGGGCLVSRRSKRAASMFLDEVDRAVDRISQNPEQCPEHEFGTRRIVLRRFPFVIVFRSASAGVEIIAIAHGRRRPGYWRERLE